VVTEGFDSKVTDASTLYFGDLEGIYAYSRITCVARGLSQNLLEINGRVEADVNRWSKEKWICPSVLLLP